MGMLNAHLDNSVRPSMSAVLQRQQRILKIKAPTQSQWVRRVQEGIPAAAIEELVALGLGRQMLLSVLGSRSTLERRLKNKAVLTSEESDRLARVAGVVALAEEVFGDKAKAVRWLQRDSIDLAGQGAPLRLLATSQGTELVRERLEQIRHGIFA